MTTISIGYRFRPTPYEILCYLQYKIEGIPLPSEAIIDFDAYASAPEILPRICDCSEEQFYFVERKRKSANGSRANREVKTAAGWWKTSAKDKPIYDDFDPSREVGKLRTLVFHIYRDEVNKSTKDTVKTDWIMHEYSFFNPEVKFQGLVVCGIRYRGTINFAPDDEAALQNTATQNIATADEPCVADSGYLCDIINSCRPSGDYMPRGSEFDA